ncbi:ABC transporter substrate-binding protein [Streptococcus ovuberis]|uniref:ABC transporter substrate-binding protein n=1 Tax=Streptococcus ovuberis TaxID=1936207 RepID=A0A7X6MXT8_9STRE|nr:ABC transporter substrate-binding protein [Streptococcus ovuberis]NKZ20325.1 ABC transporter substrate-binding protein [Streptococcus ovuberis]
MKKKSLALSLLTFASVAFLAACGEVGSNNSSSSAEAPAGNSIGETVKVGYNFELSGAVASYGITEKSGADLAVEEINAAGGIDGKPLEVISKDNKSETAESATVATSLVTEGANVVIGAATSGASAAATANLTKGGVAMISPSGTQDSLVFAADGKTVNDYFFRTTFVDSYQGKLLATYATDSLKAKKVVLYYDNSSDYAKGIADAFKEAYSGEIIETLTFAAGDKDFQAALTKIKDKDFDAIVMPGYYEETGAIVKQARDLGIKQAIAGPDGFDSPVFLEKAGAAATDVHYLSAFSTEGSEKAKKFYDAYLAKYGEEPSMFSALAYDSVYMAAQAAKGATSSVDIKDNLAKLSGFEGVTGTMSVDENHNVIKSAYVISFTDGKVSGVDVLEAK